jgi:hypothetical protein
MKGFVVSALAKRDRRDEGFVHVEALCALVQ